MRGLLWLSTFLCLSCGRGSQQGRVDTTMVFMNAAPCPPRDSLTAPSRDSVITALAAYHDKKIAADAVAPIVLHYLDTGRELNVEIDDELQAALTREMSKCNRTR